MQPQNAEAHLLLGEAYLQTKKGSKSVGHLNEAARLGRAGAHLRLATLYNAVGMKDKAAAEYEQFLAKQPLHPDRKKWRLTSAPTKAVTTASRNAGSEGWETMTDSEVESKIV